MGASSVSLETLYSLTEENCGDNESFSNKISSPSVGLIKESALILEEFLKMEESTAILSVSCAKAEAKQLKKHMKIAQKTLFLLFKDSKVYLSFNN